MASLTERLQRQRHRRQQAGQKRKSIFKLSEELHERLEKQRKDKLNSLTEFSASSWIASRLISNAILGRTGNWRLPSTNE